ncbi:hypothetical protein N9H12_00600 [Flavobacteriales bacterium]|jgi:hypothetical protein|nr:hypothetical protein [Flavobacteriales bacterium]
MIVNEAKYIDWITKNGVGQNDVVSSSISSYVSYLNSVSRIINQDISEFTLNSESSIDVIVNKIQGKRSQKTINNYKSAMRQYVRMVIDQTKQKRTFGNTVL